MLVALAVLVAVGFIVAAVLGGQGGGEGAGPAAPALPSGGGQPAPAAQAAEELGYPGFATKNTTRVGGADPASNAAAVALATFPATDAGQRPAAVALAGEDDWPAAIAAAVLAGPPIRSPLLLAAGEELPEPTQQALSALDPQGDRTTHGAQLFAIGEVPLPAGLKATRVRGNGPAQIAASLARLRDELFGSAPDHVVIASLDRAAFAMPAAAWAARSGDPVLFARHDSLPRATAEALKRHPKAPVFVLGPAAAIAASTLQEIAKIDPHVQRVSGKDPVSSSIALARYARGGFGWNVNDPGHGFVIARSDSPLDAAAAAPLSASGTWGPLLLSDNADTLPAALRDYLLDVKPGYVNDPTRAFYNHVWVIGDQEAIDVKQQGEIDELAELAKIGGKE